MRVLIAEDTEDSRVILELALAAAGYKVTSCKNGLEALKRAKALPPDLIITDIMMPEMDGYDFCRNVKADPNLKNIPFIFYTATYTDHKDQELGMALGADRFVIKPQQPKVLLDIVRDLLTEYQNKNALNDGKTATNPNELEEMHFQSVSKKLDKKNLELEAEREALKQSELKFRHLVESVQSYYFFYSYDIEGSISYVSPSIHSVLGYTSDEFKKLYPEHLTGNPKNKEAERYSQLCMLGEEQASFEVEVFHKNGAAHWLEIKEFPSFDKRGYVVQVDAIAHDISKRKQTEEVLRRSQKMDALGQLTGGIAHDYNNLLGIIVGYTQLLEDTLREPIQEKLISEDVNSYIHEISHAANRGIKLTKKILSFSRLKATESGIYNINAILRDEQNMLEKTLTARIQLVYILADNLWDVRLDGSEFEDAVLNLCINAMHAMESSGRLVVCTNNKTMNTTEAQRLHIEPGDYVVLTVTDTGSGIEPSELDKIFEPFYSTKGKKGTGLGLSQVYGFIERSHGIITVDSKPNEGTNFTMYFPQAKGSKSTHAHPREAITEDLAGNETVLVVDDEPAIVELTSRVLKKNGYNVLSANSGEQALDILEQHPKDINLLFSDVIMPEMNGYELSSIVKKNNPDIKILLASGLNDGHELNTSNFPDILAKPYSSQTLLKQVRELLG